MKNIKHELVSVPCLCLYKATLNPGNHVGYGMTKEQATYDALIHELSSSKLVKYRLRSFWKRLFLSNSILV